MKELKKLIVVFAAAVFFIGFFVLCDRYASEVKAEYASQISPSIVNKNNGGNTTSESRQNDVSDITITKMIEDMVNQDSSTDVTLTAAGDILVQTEQIESSIDYETEKFDFLHEFDYVMGMFQDSDYAVATLKTTLAGAYQGNNTDFYGYSASGGVYNTPEVLAGNIKSAGISLVNIATNHSLDSDMNGISSTINFLDAAGVAHVGAAKDSDTSTEYSVSVKGIKIGFLGYTNSTNGWELASSSDIVLNTLGNYDEEAIQKMCGRVKAVSGENEFTVVMLNFGSVDSDQVDAEQRELARKLVDAGADLILGTGSRVLKPIEKMTAVDPINGEERNALVLYGMGALLSSDSYMGSGMDTDISAVFDFDISRDEFGEVRLVGFTATPIYSNWYDDKIQPIPVCEAKDTDKFTDQLDEDAMERIDSAYENTMPHLLEGSGLTSTYSDYTYQVVVQ